MTDNTVESAYTLGSPDCADPRCVLATHEASILHRDADGMGWDESANKVERVVLYLSDGTKVGWSSKVEPQVEVCSCLRLDHVLLPPPNGCAVHGKPFRQEQPEPEPKAYTDEAIEFACAWVNFRKDYGISRSDTAVARTGFLAGWTAARKGDQSGVQR